MHDLANRAKNAVPGFAFILVMLLLLEAAARLGFVDNSFIPTPSAVAIRTVDISASGSVFRPLLSTTGLLFAGYATGCLAAVAIGILMGAYRSFYNLFEPLTELLRPLPKAALLPVLILFLGLGASMKVTIVALAAFFPVLINTVQGGRCAQSAVAQAGHHHPACQ